jgi:signal peptide peptidase SppA
MYPAILRAMNDSRWAIYGPKLEQILSVLSTRASGGLVDAETVRRLAEENRRDKAAAMVRSVAVLPIFGTISQRVSLLEEASGGVSTEDIGREFDTLMADDSVGAVVLNVDSPGGSIYGVPELAEKIFQARGRKPTCAIANSFMASAAYWIGTACDEVSVTPSGEAGSVGVYCVHMDTSAADEQQGFKYTFVSYGKYKAEYASEIPLSEEARAELQRRIDADGAMFDGAVAKARKVSQVKVREQFGQGRCFGAQECLDRKMADRIETFQECVARLAGMKPRKAKGKSAEIERMRLAL